MPTIGYANRSYHDYDHESGSVQIYTPAWTSGNMVANEALLVTLWSAIDAITLGTMWKHELGNRYREANPADPVSDAAQRELKWMVSFHDSTTGKRYSIELPCADTAQLDPNDKKHANIGDADVVDAFVAAFEAIAKSEAGNAVVVDEITLVGRRV